PRGDFEVKVNHFAGWNDPGDWNNYTRPFPSTPTAYHVLARLASGGQPIHLQLDEVISDPAASHQTLRKLGEFQACHPTAGWDSMEFFPLLDEAGQPAILSGLSGEKTLRLTMLPGSDQDLDYLL